MISVSIKKNCYWLSFFLAFMLKMNAQTQIGGIINIYTPVTVVGCNYATVISANGYVPGDRVLLIQMKGAVIDTTNTNNFGNILNYNNCGNYEFATILSVSGNTIFFQYNLLYGYTVSNKVQLIRVPQFQNAITTSILTCLPWDGTIGGVLALEVSGNLTLNNNIDVSGKGFRGGVMCTNPDGGCGNGNSNTDFYHPVSSGLGAEKGEGITDISLSKNGGRGALGNGGGGGNKHNSGGAGGSNFSSGGKGGDQANFCPLSPIGGIGGKSLNYNLNKIFLGGGGGCSDNNNGVGTLGTNAGGIIIIKTSTITGNGNSIISNGLNVDVIPNGIGDGAGGAGAGGTILLDIGNYTNALNVNANGGKGGDQNTSYGTCFGPGGGGGVGVIYTSSSSFPPNVIATTTEGNPGIDLYSSSPCYMGSFGAVAGEIANGVKYNLKLPENNIGTGFSFSLGNDTLICGDPITLSAYNLGATYLWSTGETSSTINVNSAGQYWVNITSGNCSITKIDTILIMSDPLISLDLGNDTIICSSDTITLNAYNSGSTYLWSTGDTSATININNPGIYWVNATSGNCPTTIKDTIQIINDTIIFLNLGNDTIICSSDTITLNAYNSGSTYLWSTGDTSATININNPGTYWVSATSGNCQITKKDTIQIIRDSLIFLNLGNDTIICTTTIILNAYNSNATYLWSTGETSATININSSGTYWANVKKGQCALRDSIEIKDNKTNFFIPNVMTPNGDMQNDFISIGDKNGPELIWTIYNRWGQKIYSERGNLLNWDGKSNNKILNAGTYFWILDYIPKCSNEKKLISEKGFITIIP